MRRRWIGLGVAVALTGMAAPALACGLAMEAPAQPTTVRRASALLARGDRQGAANLIMMEGGLRDLSFGRVDPAEVEAQFMLVKIALSTRGDVGSQGSPAQNLWWAGEVALPRLATHWGGDDPRIRTWRAVYLARSDWAHPAMARMQLELLAAQDLITAAEGWAALARLRDGSHAETAWRRCRAMAVDPDRCDIEPARS